MGGIEGAYELTAEATDGENHGVEVDTAAKASGGAASSADPIPEPTIGGESIGVLVEGDGATSEGTTADGTPFSEGFLADMAKGEKKGGPI